MFELHWPLLLALLPLPLLIIWRVKPVHDASGAALHIPFYGRLASLVEQPATDKAHSHSRHILPWLIWSLLVFAACRPVWFGETTELPSSGRDLMMAVDLSGSMEINDMTLEGQSVDRLVATKVVMDEFIARRQGDRLGLILFGSQAYLQVPLTFDRITVQTLMNESFIGMAGNKTAIGDALGLAVKQLRKRPESSRVLILLTDGANTAGEISPIQAAHIASEEHIKIYTIGLGADEMMQPGVFGSSFGARKINPSADLDEKTLTDIAQMTGGRYFRAKNTEDLEEIYELLDRLEPVEVDKQSFRPSKALFFWPLILAVLLSLIPALRQISFSRTSSRLSAGRKAP